MHAYRAPRYWVYEGSILRAAQPTLALAMRYRGPGCFIAMQPMRAPS